MFVWSGRRLSIEFSDTPDLAVGTRPIVHATRTSTPSRRPVMIAYPPPAQASPDSAPSPAEPCFQSGDRRPGCLPATLILEPSDAATPTPSVDSSLACAFGRFPPHAQPVLDASPDPGMYPRTPQQQQQGT